MNSASLKQAQNGNGELLLKKLGLKRGETYRLLNAPQPYREVILQAVEMEQLECTSDADLVLLFCCSEQQLFSQLAQAESRVGDGGTLGVSWPKRSSKYFVGLLASSVRNHVADRGWIDIKVCDIDQDWSALTFVRRNG